MLTNGIDMDDALDDLEEMIEAHEHLNHITVRKYGKTLILSSDGHPDPLKHARFTLEIEPSPSYRPMGSA